MWNIWKVRPVYDSCNVVYWRYINRGLTSPSQSWNLISFRPVNSKLPPGNSTFSGWSVGGCVDTFRYLVSVTRLRISRSAWPVWLISLMNLYPVIWAVTPLPTPLTTHTKLVCSHFILQLPLMEIAAHQTHINLIMSQSKPVENCVLNSMNMWRWLWCRAAPPIWYSYCGCHH